MATKKKRWRGGGLPFSRAFSFLKSFHATKKKMGGGKKNENFGRKGRRT